jgi:hypothetical protein
MSGNALYYGDNLAVHEPGQQPDAQPYSKPN